MPAIVVCLAVIAIAGCSDGGEEPLPHKEEGVEVRLLISLPGTEYGTRVGDPGSDTNEAYDEWDSMSLFFVYTGENGAKVPEKPVYMKTITKDDYNKLADYSGSQNVKVLPLTLAEGDVYIYGVTYSSAYIGAIDDFSSCNSKEAVQALTISNDYASEDAEKTRKFLSVATGYYVGNGTNGTPAIFHIEEVKDKNDANFPMMTLTRLAAKIDIQWDAKDIKSEYNNVTVDEFKFYGSEVASSAGSDGTAFTGRGRLFPELHTTDAGAIGGVAAFVNTSEISRKNGRVYHYVFPDGVGKPKITFKISAWNSSGNVEKQSKDYTFHFYSSLEKSVWYKINTTIKGLSGTTTIIQNK